MQAVAPESDAALVCWQSLHRLNVTGQAQELGMVPLDWGMRVRVQLGAAALFNQAVMPSAATALVASTTCLPVSQPQMHCSVLPSVLASSCQWSRFGRSCRLVMSLLLCCCCLLLWSDSCSIGV